MSKFLISLKQLEKWFHQKKRLLPWRNDPSVYRVWVSEIMLQQTQVVTVIPYFEKFIKRFPSVEALAAANEEDVLLYWAGLGYYSRARNLHRGARQILQRKKFPSNREEWLEIPGVGNYTAGAILSIANGLPEAILDGNVERVLSRVKRVDRSQGDADFKAQLWRYSTSFVETAFEHKVSPSVLNQALMELGATVCTPKNPKCEICPLEVMCEAYRKSDTEAFPPKKKPKEWLHVEENLHCVLDSSHRVLLRKRGAGEWRNGLWDLLEENPGKKKGDAEFLGELETKHIVTRHKIKRKTEIWKLKKKSSAASHWKVAESHGEDLRWVSIENPDVPMGSALKRTLQAVKDHLQSDEVKQVKMFEF
jgi:A/G-specific adenine glycosylase